MSRNNSSSSYNDRIKQAILGKQPPQPLPLDASVLLNTRVGQQPKTVIQAVFSGSCQGQNLPVAEPGCCCSLGAFIPLTLNEINLPAYYTDDITCPPMVSPTLPPGYLQSYTVVFSTVTNATDYAIGVTNSEDTLSSEISIIGAWATCSLFLVNIGDSPGTVTVTASNTSCSTRTVAQFTTICPN
jgi:hypothetical protein